MLIDIDAAARKAPFPPRYLLDFTKACILEDDPQIVCVVACKMVAFLEKRVIHHFHLGAAGFLGNIEAADRIHLLPSGSHIGLEEFPSIGNDDPQDAADFETAPTLRQKPWPLDSHF